MRVLRASDGEADRRSDVQSVLVVFLATSMIFVLAMVASFSQSVSGASSEDDRIFGRYYLFLLPYFIAFFLGIGTKAEYFTARLGAMLGVVATLAFGSIALTTFRIFPWDFPELFAFYVYPNHYAWSYDKLWPWMLDNGGYILLAASLISAVAVLLRPPLLMRVYGGLLVAILAFGQIGENSWLWYQSAAGGGIANDARSLARLLAPLHESAGAVIGAERYGRVSFVLFGLASAQLVMTKEPGTRIAQADLPPGVDWVIAADNYIVTFPYLRSVEMGSLTLYIIHSRDE